MSENFGLDELQLNTIERLRNGSVLRGDIGSGKSRTALGYWRTKLCIPETDRRLQKNNHGFSRVPDVYVITTAKKRNDFEWESESPRFGLSSSRDASIGNSKLTVDSWNNIQKYIDVSDAFFIFDEQRLVGSGGWVKAFLKIVKNNHWIMLSGTPGDSWIEYVPLFIANGFYKNRAEFIREHVIWSAFTRYPKIDRYVGTGTLAKYRDMILVEMPYKSHTIPHDIYVDVEFDPSPLEEAIKTRWDPFKNEPIVDANGLFRVLRRLVASHPSRGLQLLRLQHIHPRLIVFYNYNYELEILRDITSSVNVAMSEWNGQKHQSIPKTKAWFYLVQYTAGAEGWNCISTNAMVFFSLNYSYKLMEQSKGRINRRNTKFIDLYYYYFVTNSAPDKAVRRALKVKHIFNRRDEKKTAKELGWVDEENNG